MPSDKPARRLEDIVENAQAIRLYVAGMDLTAFEEDHKTYDAVERASNGSAKRRPNSVIWPRFLRRANRPTAVVRGL